jgi:deoxycytidylate deaminase
MAYNGMLLHFISYVWWLLQVSTLYLQRQGGAFLEPCEMCAVLIIEAFVDFQVYSNEMHGSINEKITFNIK